LLLGGNGAVSDYMVRLLTAPVRRYHKPYYRKGRAYQGCFHSLPC
jgi:hypothetical protein